MRNRNNPSRACWLFLVLGFSNCNDDTSCTACGKDQVLYRFQDSYFRFNPGQGMEHPDARFVQLDSLSNVLTEYASCLPDDRHQIEVTKVIKASGTVYEPCEPDNLHDIQFDHYEVVRYCRPTFEVKAEQASLENKWFIHSIYTSDTVLYVPCEAYPEGAFVQFVENRIDGSTGINGFTAEVTHQSSNELTLSLMPITLLVGTIAENYFEERLFDVLLVDTILHYTIDKNVLVITNSVTGASVKLFSY